MGQYLALSFKGQNRGHRPVQKIPVMADDQHRAIIGGYHLLQQIDGLHIQIIGRLIQHQKIMRLGKNTGQQKPVLLTA